MGASTETRTFNNLFTATLDAYVEDGKAVVNTLTRWPLIDRLYRTGNTKVRDGGVRIDVNLSYGYNPGTQWFNGADVLDMTPYEFLTTAKFDWKQLHAPISYTGEEIRKNRGKEQLIDLVEEKLSTTQRSLWKVLDIAIAGDGTANGGKVILGLDAIFPVAATVDPAIGAIGGVAAAGNTWWQNYSVASFGSFAANGPKGTTQDLFVNTWNSISDGPDGPGLIISAQNVYEFYHRSNLSAMQIYKADEASSKNSVGDLTFPSLKYMGVDWFWSRNIAAGRAYFIRENDLAFWVHSQANMTLAGEFQKSFNQDLYANSMLFMCAFFPKRRMFSAVLDGITA